VNPNDLSEFELPLKLAKVPSKVILDKSPSKFVNVFPVDST
jgi:hypothetical protein